MTSIALKIRIILFVKFPITQLLQFYKISSQIRDFFANNYTIHDNQSLLCALAHSPTYTDKRYNYLILTPPENSTTQRLGASEFRPPPRHPLSPSLDQQPIHSAADCLPTFVERVYIRLRPSTRARLCLIALLIILSRRAVASGRANKTSTSAQLFAYLSCKHVYSGR